MDIVRDVPIILTTTNYEDVYDGDFITRRSIIYTFSFQAKTYLYGPVATAGVVQKVTIDQYADLKEKAPPRVHQYTIATEATSTGPDDDNFGFNETITEWTDQGT